MSYTAQVISYSTTSSSAKDLSIVLRQSTEGPELDIVYHFFEEHLRNFQTEYDLAVFVEPRLDSGFPDMVVAFWNKEISEKWSFARSLLQRSDILLMHHVNLTGELPITLLSDRMGAKKSAATIQRLLDAGVVELTASALIKKPLNEVFAINRLIAIEAKVRHWKKGLEQAFRNTWFASETYLLLGAIPQSQPMLADAARLGVGILDKHHSISNPYADSKVGELPVSYASWLFNEWVWKHELIKGAQ